MEECNQCIKGYELIVISDEDIAESTRGDYAIEDLVVLCTFISASAKR